MASARAILKRVILFVILCFIECHGELQTLEEQLADARASAKRCLVLVKGYKEGAKQLEEKLKDCQDNEEAKREAHNSEVAKQLDQVKLENSDLKLQIEDLQAKLSNMQHLQKENEKLKRNTTDLISLGKKLRKQANVFREDAEDAIKELEVERELTKRLSALCEKKGSDDAIQNLVVQNKQQNFIQQLEMKIQSLQEKLLETKNSNVDEEAELEAQIRVLRKSLDQSKEQIVVFKENLSSSKRKLNATSTELKTLRERYSENEQDLADARESVEACQSEMKLKNQKIEKHNADQIKFLEEKEELEDRIKDLIEEEKRWKTENEALEKVYKEYKAKADNPALVDYIAKRTAWLKNPKVEGLDKAYDKTIKVFGPRLNRTELAIKELSTLLELSSKSISKMVGKPEISPVVSGLLTYGILLIPFTLSICLLVRVRRSISFTKITLWMTLYNALFCYAAFGMYFVARDEPMFALRKANEEAYEFLQLLIAASFIFYYVFLCLGVVKQVMLENGCRITWREIIQIVVPCAISAHYYQFVWLLAMMDKEPRIDYREWAYYGAGFNLVFCTLSFCRKKIKSIKVPTNSKLLPEISKTANVDEKPEAEDNTVQNTKANTEIAESGKKKKSKKKKKHKHGHRVAATKQGDENTIEVDILDPEKLVEDAESFAEAATTGASLEEIRERKEIEKRTAKTKAASESGSDEDLESQKLD